MGTGSDSRIRFPNRSIRPAAAARTREPRPTRKDGIPWFVDDDRPVVQLGTRCFQCSPRTESDFGVRFPNQSVETGGSAADAIRINPETAESRGSQTMTSQPPNRPRPRNRTKSNLDRRSLNQSTDTTGTICESGPHHPGTAVFRDSLPHTAESPHTVCGLIPNPTPNLRISPRTPPPQRTEVAHTNPETAKYRGSRNRYKSSHRQPPTSHTDKIQSRGPISEPVHDGGPHGRRSPPTRSRKQRNTSVLDYRRPAAHPDAHRFQCSPRPESDFGVRFPNRSAETDNPADGHN
ncbi:hypothetical protein BPORC_1004 [Bifidobacterium porcinum]|nr:hypothetical protein BPORC_1004 [Bifidobacterium porcinum]